MDSFPLKLNEYPEVSPVRRANFHPSKRIGFWMSPKKLKKMDMTKFSMLCRSGGFELVQVELTRPLADQGPFDVFFHKLTDLIVKAEQSGNTENDTPAGNEEVQQFRALEYYLKKHPEIVVIDPIPNLRQLLRRLGQYRLVATSQACRIENVFTPSFVELTSTDPVEMAKQLKRAGVAFPVICKPQEAHGSSEAHQMMIIFNEKGLVHVKNSCVAQSFVNHDAVLYKVFVIGRRFHIVRRPSFHNFYSVDLPPVTFDSQNIAGATWMSKKPSSTLIESPIAASSLPDGIGEELDTNTVERIVSGIRERFGLSLIGIDLIRQSDSNKLAIIDVNAFPSYDGVPDFFPILFNFLKSQAPLHPEKGKMSKNNFSYSEILSRGLVGH